jgi:hypothetical protein
VHVASRGAFARPEHRRKHRHLHTHQRATPSRPPRPPTRAPPFPGRLLTPEDENLSLAVTRPQHAGRHLDDPGECCRITEFLGGAVVSFLLGSLVLAVDLGWTVFRIMRAHYRQYRG